MEEKQQDQLPKPQGLNIGVDPMRTPILYADAIVITASNNGFVLDVAQRIGSSNQAAIVARIGLSKEHVKTLIDKLQEQLTKEGRVTTGKIDIN